MAKYADAWNADRQNDIVTLQETERRVDQACAEAGRKPETLDRYVGIQVDMLNEDRDPKNPRQFVMAPWPLIGSVEELADQIRAHNQAHVNHMMVWIDPNTIEGVEAFAPVLELLDQAN